MNNKFPTPRVLACLVAIVATSFQLSAAPPAEADLPGLLKRYPAADTNHDGVLTPEEAQAYSKVLAHGKAAGNENVNGERTGGRPRPEPTHANVRYGPDPKNLLDLWLAKSPEPTPLVVFIHGGGFVNGSKAGVSGDMVRFCLDAGVSFMSIDYRFRTVAPIQDILRDCARSLQFVRYHAREYGIDAPRVACYGGSAGAGTSLWLAFHPDLADAASPDPVLRESSRIVAAAAINPQATYDIRQYATVVGKPNPAWIRPEEEAAFYGFSSEQDFESERGRRITADVDMLGLISKDDPPVFLYAAMPDGPAINRGHFIHHPNHARAVKARCDAVGVPATIFFAMAEPRAEGDYQVALREFLLAQLHAKPAVGNEAKVETRP